VELDLAKQEALDALLAEYGSELKSAQSDEKAAITLAYTHRLHRSWRTALRMLPVSPAWSVLDIGTGMGILSFELAANLPLAIRGIDIESTFVTHSQELQRRLATRPFFAEGASVHFSQGDVLALEVPDDSVDLAFVREILQFLPEPVDAVRQVYRALRPGGYACVSDIDDQFHITWPQPSPAQARLIAAVATRQHGRGGDRHAGRKLSTYLSQAGFDIASVVVLPEAQHRMTVADDTERSFILEQLRAARPTLIESGSITAEQFDTDLATFEAEPPHEEFRMNARIIVLGHKPASS
jgi:ubiquinone/menaquinone biosynthesis C-methylase UbiE